MVRTSMLMTALAFALLALGCDGGGGGGGSGSDAGAMDGGAGGLPPNDQAPLCTGGGQWCWSHPFPHGNDLYGVHGVGNDVFVVGAAGSVMSRVDGVWRTTALEGGHKLYDVTVGDAESVYVVGSVPIQAAAVIMQ